MLKLGALEGTSFGNYLHTMRFFDQALEDFKAALARDGLLDDSVLVVFGDHDAGLRRATRALARTIGIGADEVAWTLNDRVPLFIRVVRRGHAGARRPDQAHARESRPARPISRRRCSRCSASMPRRCRTSAATCSASDGDRPVPRPYGDWLDAHHLFLARGAASPSCYDLRRRALASPSATAPRRMRSSRRARDLSRLIVVDDLQQRAARHASRRVPIDEYNAARPHALRVVRVSSLRARLVVAASPALAQDPPPRDPALRRRSSRDGAAVSPEDRSSRPAAT